MSRYAGMTAARKAAEHYVRAIRNERKRAYARAYLAKVFDGASGPLPSEYPGYMAAQAVRLRLDALAQEAADDAARRAS
jgi:serine/threonine protein phosphatase PrpC